jgi:hypothetical protein
MADKYPKGHKTFEEEFPSLRALILKKYKGVFYGPKANRRTIF